MPKRIASTLTALTVSAVSLGLVVSRAPGTLHGDGLVVHEWGTFTTVAGADGRAVDWLPLGGPTDLPCFVYHYENRRDAKLLPATIPLDYASARANLLGRVRMETPVIYFHAPRDMSVDVTVRFPRGLMTEWYPAATVTQSVVARTTLRSPSQASTIRWPSVAVSPGAASAFPTDVERSHYYAARATDASPLIAGEERERFLFYRGVADFDVPLAAVALDDGGVRVTNLGSEELPAVVLFENRGGALGWRMHGSLQDEVTLAPPALDRTFADLQRELERMLFTAGLTAKEAAAMVETWRDSWFEEGARVFYIVPRRAVDEILPLTVDPAPAAIVRVFVGRMDVITPAVRRSVEQAIAAGDTATLARHGRLLGAITERILAGGTSAGRRARMRRLTDAAFETYHGRVTICE